MTTSRFPQNIVGFKIFMMLILKASGSVMMCGFSARTSTFSLFSIIALPLHSQQAPTSFCPRRWCDKVFHVERVKFTNGADRFFFFFFCACDGVGCDYGGAVEHDSFLQQDTVWMHVLYVGHEACGTAGGNLEGVLGNNSSFICSLCCCCMLSWT